MTTKTAIHIVHQDHHSQLAFEELKVLEGSGNVASILSRLQKTLLQNNVFLNEMINHMVRIMGWYHLYTRYHSESVAKYSHMIAAEMDSAQPNWVKKMYDAGLLHDIGKLQVPTNLLDNGQLMEGDEDEMVKMHTLWGARVLYTAGLDDITEMVLHHHERFDGNGYPYGISGKQIPLGARILAVADVFDKMMREHRNGKSLSIDEAKEELLKRAGHELDPEIVQILVKIDNTKIMEILDH